MERRNGFSPSLTQKTGNDIILSQIIDIKYLPLYKNKHERNQRYQYFCNFAIKIPNFAKRNIRQ